MFKPPSDLADYYAVVAPSTIDSEFMIRPSKADGVYLWEGNKKYIDFDASVATVPLGHKHPLVNEAIFRQLDTVDSVECSARPPKFFITVANREYEISPEALGRKLLDSIFPNENARVIYGVTGAEGVNIAVKFLLYQRPRRRRFIAFEGAFHGRKGYALDLTLSKAEQKRYYPTSGITVLHLPLPKKLEDVERIKNMLARYPLDEVNAIFVEAIQGEGGIEVFDTKLWHMLAPILEKNKIAIVADEIQCGIGRTGSMWGFQLIDIHPDIVVAGKGLANGTPISVVAYKRKLEKKLLTNGWDAGTFPGHPTALAAGTITFSIIQEEKTHEHILEMSKYLSHKLEFAIPKKYDGENHYCVLKGAGLMQGIEFRNFDDTPDPKTREIVLRAMKNWGILTIPCGHSSINPTIRLLPPYLIQKEHIDKLINCLCEIFSSLEK
ncbi:MAG: aspartate aminotransferase family protein [Patescibacteria group bacterium]